MKTLVQSIIIVVVTVVLVIFSASAQQSSINAGTGRVSLTGRIVDEKGNPISMAIVKIMESPESVEQRAITQHRAMTFFFIPGFGCCKIPSLDC